MGEIGVDLLFVLLVPCCIYLGYVLYSVLYCGT
jgi:hypothetical protein